MSIQAWSRFALAALLVVGTVAPVRAQDLPTVRVGRPEALSLTFMALDIGQIQGIWKKVGIDLEMSSLRGDAQVQQGLTAGSLDIGLGSGPALAFLAKGVPALAVAALTGAPDHMVLVVPPNSPIKSIGDLKGKRIGVTTNGAVTEWLAQQAALKEGWPISAITTVPLGDGKGNIAGMKTGAVDAFVSSADIANDLVEHHEGRIVFSFGRVVVQHFHSNLIFANRTFITNHPELVKKFLQGWFQTIAYMRGHRQETAKLAAKASGFSEDTMGKAFDALVPTLSTNGVFDMQALAMIAKSFTDMGIVDHPVDPTQYITTAFVPVRT